MELGLVKTVDIDKEMQQAYLDYAMSVIVSRALPDARDGLKPVHRRILYAMHDMNLSPGGTHKKSARIVGEVLGKYHPHGDQAVYDAMARMIQEFSSRYPLVDGQGNFGSIDGDPPAAMRYTEARMAPIALDVLTDLEKDTVDFTSNFDDTLTEPSVLPASIPNFLVNGATGIAVGMSTSVPPHNLEEVTNALIFMLKNWDKLDDINVDDLMQYVQGPDFPTGGIIIQGEEGDALKSSYGTGRGRITIQARIHTEEAIRGRTRLIITELPFMTNKSSLIERIAGLARDGQLEGLSDLRDESARDEMRIVIELSKGAEPQEILRTLYKKTPLQSTFSMIFLALVNGEPRMLSLKQALRVFLEHRHEVVRRRSEHDLDRARKRAHILEGIRIAIANLDDIISTIRRSPDVDTARGRLMRKFKLSEEQAVAILNMPLRRLASLERKKIEAEYKELQKTIKDLVALLKSPRKMRIVIANELEDIKVKYGDRRRTNIVSVEGSKKQARVLTAKDLTPEKDVWVSVTTDGLISRTVDDKQPRLSGTAAAAHLLTANTRDTLFIVTDQGEAAAVGVHNIPEADKPTEGVEFTQISPFRRKAPVAAIFNLPLKDTLQEGWYVTTITRGGMVKKSDITELPGPTSQTFQLVRINDGDRLGWIHITNGENDILLATARGMAIRFKEEEVRPMGLVAAGVMGIKLKVGDEVVGAVTLPDKGEVFLVRTDGIAKRVKPGQYPTQGRYGLGVVTWKLPKGGRLAGMSLGQKHYRITMHLLKLAPKLTRLDAAPIRTRPSNGHNIQELKGGDKIVFITSPMEYPRPQKPEKPKSKRKSRRKSTKSRTKKASTKKTAAKKSSRRSRKK